MTAKPENMKKAAQGGFINATDCADYLVSKGMPFRDAYKKVGLDIEAGNFTPNKNVRHTHEGSIGNLCTKEIADLMHALVEDFHFERIDKAVEALLA